MTAEERAHQLMNLPRASLPDGAYAYTLDMLCNAPLCGDALFCCLCKFAQCNEGLKVADSQYKADLIDHILFNIWLYTFGIIYSMTNQNH